MSSARGPRASGTDGADHKFRQRVDNHYKTMADGRARLGQACKAHLAGALGLAGAAAAIFALAGDDGPDALALAAVGGPALLCIYLGNVGRGAGKLTEAAAAGFSRANAVLAVLLVGLGGYLAAVPQEQLVLVVTLVGALAAFIGCLLGSAGARGLLAGFALQTGKRGK